MAGAFSSAFASAFDSSPSGVGPGALVVAGPTPGLNLTVTPGSAALAAAGATPTASAASAIFLTSAQGASSNGTTTSATLDTTGAGALFAWVASQAGAPVPDIVDSKGNQWTRWGSSASSTNVVLTFWYCGSPTSVGTGHVISVPNWGTITPALHVQAFACAPIIKLDVSSSAGNSALISSQAPGSITPTGDNAIIVTGLACGSTNPTSINAGFTLDQSTTLVGSQHYGLGSAHLIQGTAAASNPTWSANGAQRLCSIQAAFLVGQATGEERISQLTLEAASIGTAEQRVSQLVLESFIDSGVTIVDRAALTWIGYAPTVGNGRHVAAGTLALAGAAPSVQTASPAPAGSLLLTGLAPVLAASSLPGAGTLTIAGYAVALGSAQQPPVGALVWTGQAPSLSVRSSIAVGAGAVTIGGTVSTLQVSTPTNVPTCALILTGLAPSAVITLTATSPATGVLTWTGHAPTSLNNSAVGNLLSAPATGRLTLTGYVPTIALAFPLPRTIDVDPPNTSPVPCTSEQTASEGSGGRGANGCNPGGTGWTPSYTGPVGSVPAHDDPATGDLIGDGLASLWVEVADGASQTKVAAVFLAETDIVARNGLLSGGSIEHALGNEQGGYEVSTLSIGFCDEQDRLMRSGIDNIEGDEIRVKLIVES